MADLNELEKEFEKYATTLQETSRGGKNKKEFLCQSQARVYNFEQYVDYKEKEEKNPYFSKKKRIDALYVDKNDNVIYCIEFKIEKYSQINKKDIEEKFIDSFEMLKIIFKDLNLAIKNYHFKFFVVHKNIDDYFNIRKLKEKVGFEIKLRLDECKKQFLALNIENKVGDKNNFKDIYKQIFSDNC